MANSKVSYVGNGVTDSFTITFPYISSTHLKVFVDDILNTSPNMYTVPTTGTVKFKHAPEAGAVIKIIRSTSLDSRLVDYNDGAILTEQELDLDSKQAFYLAQETNENYAELIENAMVTLAAANGVIVTDPLLVIDQLVQNILDQSVAANLQARITDIDTNASNILSATTTLDGQQAVITQTASTVVAQQATITQTSSTVAAQQDAITQTASEVAAQANDIVAIQAKYGIALNVNGFITGFSQINDGTTGSFQILADEFYIVDPANNGQNPTLPFAVVNGIVQMQNVVVSGGLVAGTLTGNTIQTSAAGQRMVLNGSTNEAEFFGNRGDGTIAKLATIGITVDGGDNIVGDFGDITSGNVNTAIRGSSFNNAGIWGRSSFGEGGFFTSTNGPGVLGIGDEGGQFQSTGASACVTMSPADVSGSTGLLISAGSTSGSTHMYLFPNSSIPAAPSNGIGQNGQLVVSGNGHLYFKKSGVWQQLTA